MAKKVRERGTGGERGEGGRGHPPSPSKLAFWLTLQIVFLRFGGPALAAGANGRGSGGGGGKPLHPPNSDFLFPSFFQICNNLVFWPVCKPPSSLKWAFWPFARPHPSPQKANLGFWKGGGGRQNSELHPSKLASWPLGGLGQGWQNPDLVFLACFQALNSLKWAFWPFARPRPSPQKANLGFWKPHTKGKESRWLWVSGLKAAERGTGGERGEGGRGHPPPLSPSKLAFWLWAPPQPSKVFFFSIWGSLGQAR